MPAANKNFRILYPYNKPLLEMKKQRTPGIAAARMNILWEGGAK